MTRLSLFALVFAVVGYVSGAFPNVQESVTHALEDAFPGLIGSGPGQIDINDIISARAGAGIIGLVGATIALLGGLGRLYPWARPELVQHTVDDRPRRLAPAAGGACRSRCSGRTTSAISSTTAATTRPTPV